MRNIETAEKLLLSLVSREWRLYFTSTLLHMLSASHRPILEMKPYCKHIPFFIRMAHEYIPASSS